jgi:hypothetical protein
MMCELIREKSAAVLTLVAQFPPAALEWLAVGADSRPDDVSMGVRALVHDVRL